MNIKDQATSIRQKLSNIANNQNIIFQSVQTNFFIERLLARLVNDQKLAKSLVFKGGYVALRVYDSPRYTIDLDALLIKSKVPEALESIKTLALQNLNDGVWFEFDHQLDLKTQGEYGGVRQIYRVGIGEKPKNISKAQSIHFDLGVGDPITPGPKKMKTLELIGDQELSWSVYPIETMIAEKVHALIHHGEFNSRAKDVFDLMIFLPKANKKDLHQALKSCFEYRETILPKNIALFLTNLDTTILKKGWPAAVSSLINPPDFDNAFQEVISYLQKLKI